MYHVIYSNSAIYVYYILCHVNTTIHTANTFLLFWELLYFCKFVTRFFRGGGAAADAVMPGAYLLTPPNVAIRLLPF